jgi:hypothetical protein
MSMNKRATANWTESEPPRIHTETPAYVIRAMKAALRDVDREFTLQGAVSCATVEACRAVLALLKT